MFSHVVFFKISEWIAATPFMTWLPTMHRCAMLIFFSAPSSTSDILRSRSTSPGHLLATCCRQQCKISHYYAKTTVNITPVKYISSCSNHPYASHNARYIGTLRTCSAAIHSSNYIKPNQCDRGNDTATML
jgi:hypothetical protein